MPRRLFSPVSAYLSVCGTLFQNKIISEAKRFGDDLGMMSVEVCALEVLSSYD